MDHEIHLSAVASRFNQNETHESTTKTAKRSQLPGFINIFKHQLTNARSINLNQKVSHVALKVEGHQKHRILLNGCEVGKNVLNILSQNI